MTELYYVLTNVVDSSFDLLSITVPFIVLGVILAELIVALRLVDKIAFISRPLTNFAHLSEECGVSFMTAFIAPTSASSMLATFYNSKRIEKKELFIASIMNSFPVIVMHWSSMLPVLIPLLGVTGLLYFCILVLVGLIMTSIAIISGRFLLVQKDGRHSYKNSIRKERPPLKEALKISLRASTPTIKRIMVIIIPVIFIMSVLQEVSVFDALSYHLLGISTFFPVPTEGLAVIAAYFGHFVAGVGVASALLSAGELTSREVIITLLVGDVLANIMIILKWLIPHYVGIFAPKIGMQLLAVATVIRTGTILLVIFVLILLR